MKRWLVTHIEKRGFDLEAETEEKAIELVETILGERDEADDIYFDEVEFPEEIQVEEIIEETENESVS